MDRRTIVTSAAASPATVTVEQAVFTSVPSPLGSGYRVVAASPGVGAEEKREVTQRAPSHNNLCDATEGATGLASFSLRSGRQCVFFAHNASAEYSGRGGCRVHTRVLVMDQVTYHKLRCDPLLIRALVPPCGEAQWRAPGAQLEPVSIAVPREPGEEDPPPARERSPTDAEAERVRYILAAVLARRHLVVFDAPNAENVLRWTLAATPRSVRERLSVSYGLKYAPARRFQLMFTTVSGSDIERIKNDPDLTPYSWNDAPPAVGSEFDPWAAFAIDCWKGGRAGDIALLASELTQEVTAPGLAHIALLWTDLSRMQDADAALVDQLLRKHYAMRPETRVHARLRDELRRMAEARKNRERALTPPPPPPPVPASARRPAMFVPRPDAFACQTVASQSGVARPAPALRPGSRRLPPPPMGLGGSA